MVKLHDLLVHPHIVNHVHRNTNSIIPDELVIRLGQAAKSISRTDIRE